MESPLMSSSLALMWWWSLISTAALYPLPFELQRQVEGKVDLSSILFS